MKWMLRAAILFVIFLLLLIVAHGYSHWGCDPDGAYSPRDRCYVG